MGILAVAFVSGIQMAFIVLAFAAGVAVVGLIAILCFWFFQGFFERMLKRIDEHRQAAQIAELENRIAERRRQNQK